MKLESPFLGDIKKRDRVRRFKMHKDGGICLDTKQWMFAISEAVKSTELKVNLDAIRLPQDIKVSRVDLYTRRWHDSSGMHSEDFECIRSGSIVSVDILSMTGSESSNEPGPDKEDLYEIFNFIGNWIGLSPWGSKFNYGRFKIIED